MRLVAVTFFAAQAAFAMYPANPKDTNMPVQHLVLGVENEIEVGAEGVRVKMELGHLEPGWYELIEDGYDDTLLKEGNEYFDHEDNSGLLGFYVDAELSRGKKRFALVTKAGSYRFWQILRTQENFLSVIGDFDRSRWSNHGAALDNAEFENFPDCPFVHSIPKAGTVQKVKYTLTRRDDSSIPAEFVEQVSQMKRFH